MNKERANDRAVTTPEAVVAAARRLFERFGPAKTSMEEIAREAGLSKATLYNYFGGKEAVIAGVIEYERKALVDKLQKAVDDADGPVEALRAFLLTRSGEVQRHRRAYRAGREEFLRHMPQVSKAIEQNRREERAIIERVLAAGVSAGAFREIEDIPLTADVIFTSAIGITFPLFGTPVKGPQAGRVAELAKIFLTGICTEGCRSHLSTKEPS